MLVFLMGTKSLLISPTAVINQTGTSAWISLFISTALTLVGLWGWIKWCRLTGTLGFVASARLTLGRFLGDLLSLVLIASFVLGSSMSVRIFAGGAVIGLLPKFPIEVLLGISIFASIYAAWLGLEPVARCASFFFPLTVLSLLAIFLGSRNLMDVRNLAPYWGLGVGRTLRYGLIDVGLFGALPAIAVFKPYLRRESDLSKGGLWGVFLTGAFLVVAVLLVGSVFSYPLAARKVEPMGIIARAAYLGRYIERIEALFVFSWFFASAVQTSVIFSVILITLADLMGTHTFRPLVPSTAVLTFALGAIPADTLRASNILSSLFFETTGNAFVPLGWVLYLIAAMRKVKASGTVTDGGEGEAGDKGA